MQAILMAAGMGTRLGALAADKPKSFGEIKGKSLVDINLHMLRECGINNITIVTGYHSDMFERKYGNEQDIDLIYNPFYPLTNVIGSFYMGMQNLKEDFIYMHADTICEPSILQELLASSADVVLPIDTRSCDEEAMKVKTKDGSVCAISKKIEASSCDGEFIGVTKIRTNVLKDLKENTCDLLRRGAYSEYFEAPLQETILNGTYKTELIETRERFWAEVDFLEDYERATRNIPAVLYQF